MRKTSHAVSAGLGRRRLDVLQRVVEAEPLPLEAAHLVERQHLDALDVAESGRELGDLRQVVSIVGQARHEHEADPDRLAARREPARERQRRLDVHAGERRVALRDPTS